MSDWKSSDVPGLGFQVVMTGSMSNGSAASDTKCAGRTMRMSPSTSSVANASWRPFASMAIAPL